MILRIIVKTIYHGVPSDPGGLGWHCAVGEAEGAARMLGKHEHRCGRMQDVVAL